METNIIKKLRNRILEVALRDGMGHIPSALSILHIIWYLHDEAMTPDDVFILSKGHGCMALYAVLEEKKLMQWDSRLWGHPKRGEAITASTGSLGHGMPMAVGMALAKKIKGEKGRVFCLIGDGECNEGTIWESSLLANHHELDNLVIIVDDNRSTKRALRLENLSDRSNPLSDKVNTLADKFHAFGFSVWNIYGHSQKEIVMALKTDVSQHEHKPLMIIADTTKGYGVELMRDNYEWHNKKITKEIYESIIS